MPPSAVVTVIVTVPAATAVTKPAELTVAIAVLLDDQLTDLLEALPGAIVAVSCCVAATDNDVLVGLIVTPVTATVVTVTAQMAVLLPSWVVTVTVAVPAATAVTRPLVFTVAIAVLLDDQLTVLLVALLGAMVAVSCCVPPTETDAVVGIMVTPVTGMLVALTVIADVAVRALSLVVAVIVAVPAAIAVTKPDVLTVATAVLLDDHVTPVTVAFDGTSVAVSCCVPFTARLALVGLTVTPVTGTGCVLYQLPL